MKTPVTPFGTTISQDAPFAGITHLPEHILVAKALIAEKGPLGALEVARTHYGHIDSTRALNVAICHEAQKAILSGEHKGMVETLERTRTS